MKFINKKKIIFTTINLVIIFFLLFFLGSCIGKTVSNIQINSTGNVAKPIIIVENGPKVQLTATNNQNNYIFKVKNYNEYGEITHVDIKYNIEISNDIDDAILMKLFKNNKEIQIKDNRSQYFILTKDNKKQDEFRLEVKYDKTKSTLLDDIVKDVQIKVHSEQQKM